MDIGIQCPSCGTEMVGDGPVKEVAVKGQSEAGPAEVLLTGPPRRRCPNCGYVEDHSSDLQDVLHGRR